MAKKATGKVNKAAPNKKKPQSQPKKEVAQVPSEKKKRQPRMLPRTLWLLYAQIVMARSAEEAFDVLARTFEDRACGTAAGGFAMPCEAASGYCATLYGSGSPGLRGR